MGKYFNQHFVYGLILAVVIVNFVVISSHNYDNLKEDYTMQIDQLRKNVLYLDSEVMIKQAQIDKLSSRLLETNLQVEEVGQEVNQVNREYGLRFDEIGQQIEDIDVESEDFSDVISDVINSVVSVITSKGQGSGAIISSDGYVVTNYHVINDITSLRVLTYDGSVYGAEVVGEDSSEDVAVLKILSESSFEFLDFSNSDELRAGQKIVALGNPAGLSFTATEGIVSSPKREISGGEFIQTDVTINPGNSGGPLIDLDGEVVGLVNFKISGYDELGFAIPSNRVKRVVEGIV